MIDYRKLAVNAGAIAVNNSTAYYYDQFDSAFNSILAPLNVGAMGKYVKTLTYDLAALAALELTEKESETTRILGAYLAEIGKGLGTLTLKVDPYNPPATNVSSTSATNAAVVPTNQPMAVKVIY